MYRNPTDPLSESAVSPWMASILMRRGGSAWQRFALYYRQLAAMPRRWRRQLRRKTAVGLGSAALVLALAGPIVAAPSLQPAAPEATIVVVNGEVANVNNNKCGLIEAIINARAANAGAMRPDCANGNVNGPDTVSLPTNGNFVLTTAHNEQFGATGLPVITSAVTIDGHGATIRRSSVSGTPDFRILAVDANGALTLNNTTITNGATVYGSGGYYDFTDKGGGILALGTLTLSGATITDNATHGSGYSAGGGVFANGATTITDSIISSNHADGRYHSDFGRGGGLFAGFNGHATITGSTIANNTAGDYYGSGGGIYASGSSTLISDTIIEGNVTIAGAGIQLAGHGTATITGSTIANNLARFGHYNGSEGGGIDVGNSHATIVDSTIVGNTVAGNYYNGGDGGGVHVEPGSQVTISGSTIVGNEAMLGSDRGSPYVYPGHGGGVSNQGETTIINSTVSDNIANEGGGLFNSETLTVIHSTVSGNLGKHYHDESGYVYDDVYGIGGGVYTICDDDEIGAPVTTLRGVILSGNTADDAGNEGWLESSSCATMAVNANNLFGQNGNAGLVGFSKGATDIVPSGGLATILSPLADNGGPTQTHALPANSPALDRAPNASCTAAPVNGVDQRGEPLNQIAVGGVTNNECDVGSFERAGAAALGFYLSATNNGTVGGVAFAPGDIIKFTPAGGWAMHFDASDVGITKNVVAFEIEDNGDILLSLVAPQNVPGVGNVAPQDVLRFMPTSTGNNTAGSFALALDGSANLLTTSGEKIDALGLTGNGRLAISTAGAAAVKRPDNSVLKAQDEDALGFNLSNGQWSEVFNGTAIPGLAAEDVNALWIDPTTGDLYISIVGAFNLGGIAGNGRDIVKLTPSGAPGGYTPSLVWDGSDNGFPTNIDGLEMMS